MQPDTPGDGPEPIHHDHHPELVAANARAGLVLFAIYLGLYAGFVLLSAFAPAVMALVLPGGLNVAIVYGMGLIAAAFVLALIYMQTCSRIVKRHVAKGDRR